MTRQKYYDIAYGKTAALFSLACVLGAKSVKGVPGWTDAAEEAGKQLGIAYQIYDDLCDWFMSEKDAGKTLGTDLLSGKQTFPLIALIETMGDAETSGIRKAVLVGDIQGIYVGKLAGVGSAVFWLQDPTHFFLVIMLPLILLLIYNAYLVVRFVMDAKLKKQREQIAAETAAQGGAIDVEEIRRLAMEEFKKMMEQEKKSQENVVAAEEEKVEERTSDDSALQNPSTEDVKQEQDAQAVTEINQTAESVETSEEKEVESLAEQSETAEDGVSSNSSVQDAAEEAEQPADETVPQTVEETEKTDESDEKSSDDSEKPVVKKTSAAKKTSSNAKKTTAAAKTATAKKSVATAKNGAKSTGEKSTTKKSSSTTAKKTAAAKKTTATKKPATKKTEKSGK